MMAGESVEQGLAHSLIARALCREAGDAWTFACAELNCKQYISAT